MISKAKTKWIHALEQKKHRQRERLFVAEGPKVVADLMAVARPRLLVTTDTWLEGYGRQHGEAPADEVITVTEEELRSVSFLQHPQQVLAVFPMPDDAKDIAMPPAEALTLALDGVQDPGNLGTIIRVADWFGITDIYCSVDTADVWNPKVVQATMGSIARVNIHRVDLPAWMRRLPADYPTYGTLLDGDDIYQAPLTPGGLIVMGNEGNGISADVRRLVRHHLLIPNYPPGRTTADSLNVAIATAVTCAEFRRRSRS